MCDETYFDTSLIPCRACEPSAAASDAIMAAIRIAILAAGRGTTGEAKGHNSILNSKSMPLFTA
jgi:hypothetical protein